MQLDHLVWATPDLALGKEEFAELTGVAPLNGGSHPGRGTCNALVALNNNCYLEIIGPDPEQPLDGTLGQDLSLLSQSGLFAWAMSFDDLNGLAAAFAGTHVATKGPFDMHRQVVGGPLLEWQILGTRCNKYAGLVPFFINWQQTPHPSVSAPKVGDMLACTINLPEDACLHKLVAPNAQNVDFRLGDPFINLVFNSPKGEVHWRHQKLAGFRF